MPLRIYAPCNFTPQMHAPCAFVGRNNTVNLCAVHFCAAANSCPGNFQFCFHGPKRRGGGCGGWGAGRGAWRAVGVLSAAGGFFFRHPPQRPKSRPQALLRRLPTKIPGPKKNESSPSKMSDKNTLRSHQSGLGAGSRFWGARPLSGLP